MAEHLKPGDPVWYSPSLRGPRFAAVVDSEPWSLGGHTAVVRLRELGSDYQERTGRQRTTVPAAACSHIERRDPEVSELRAEVERLRGLYAIECSAVDELDLCWEAERAEVERLRPLAEVPDVWICSRCQLELVERAFDPRTGEVGTPRVQETPACPNGHAASMRRQTWKERCLSTETLLEAACDETRRLRAAIETLVRDEVISAGRARELHGMTPEQQRESWREHYRQKTLAEAAKACLSERVVLPDWDQPLEHAADKIRALQPEEESS